MIDVIPGYRHALVAKRKGRKTRYYFQYDDGPRIELLYPPGSPEFDQLYQSFLSSHKDREPEGKRRRRSDVLPYKICRRVGYRAKK